MLQTISHDLRLAVRSLLASRVQSGIAIMTLALGIGVNASIFSVLDSLLFRPLPFADAGRLVDIWNFAEKSKVSFPRFPLPVLREWKKQTDVFDRMEAYDTDSVTLQGPRGAELVSATFVTPGLLPLLGIPPLQGRLFNEGDGREGTDAQIVISERFWRESLGSPEAVIGSAIVINDRPHTVIGVMPATFYFPYQPQDAWLPVDMKDPPAARQTRFAMTAFARLAPGVTFDRATSAVTERGTRIRSAMGGEPGIGAILQRRDKTDPRTRQSLIVLGGAVAFLLLIVCANIANLSLARTMARGRDFAVRSALGASRRDLIRETVIENLVIGVLGSIGGLAVAALALKAAATFIPQEMTFQSLNSIDLDGRALGFTLLAGLLTAVLFGLPPAIIGSRPNILGVLRIASRSSSGSTAARRFRSSLVVGEVTIAIVLLVGAALMTRSYLKLQSVDRGFDSDGLVAVRIGFPAGPYADAAVRDRFSDDLVRELRTLPGVTSATAGSVPPDNSITSFGKIELAEAPGTLSDELMIPVYMVWPTYFSTLNLKLVEGRTFTDDEPAGAVIVSQSYAKKFWPGQSALGRRFRFEDEPRWFTVVGVSAEVRQLGLDDAEGAYEWFEPMRVPPGTVARPRRIPAAVIDYRTFVVRADNPVSVGPQLSQAVHRLDQRMVVGKTDVVNDLFTKAIARPRVVLLLLMVFSGMGLILSAAGLYGVLSYLVTQRMREIGIRLALGARPDGVFRLILRSGLTLTATGLALGLIATLYLVRVMRVILYEVEGSDPVAVLSMSALLLATALFACWRPARRAMKVDPVSLLREQ
ncbi:MAG TPA: ABC transporter permease [Vicinamibacterales bacterium]|nr:ABC transporter permease [Vicinamibacterales bacterium]